MNARNHCQCCSLPLCLLLVSVWWSLSEAGKGQGTPPAPTAGWCKTKHRPKKPAQSGHRGFCKACFREKFPKEHEEKQRQRKNTCSYCHDYKDIQSNGFCKPCISARSCDRCDGVNVKRKAPTCSFCVTTRDGLGAGQHRLALWCASCYSEVERKLGRCCACFEKFQEFQEKRKGSVCDHCGNNAEDAVFEGVCAISGCERREGEEEKKKPVPFLFCKACSPRFRGLTPLQCASCWVANGRICVICSSHGGRNNFNMFRNCKACRDRVLCKVCLLPPPDLAAAEQCHVCQRLALWCPDHSDPQALDAGFCQEHLDRYASACFYCPASGTSSSYQWRPCSTPTCTRRTPAGESCAEQLPMTAFVCQLCWKTKDKICIRCSTTAARSERQY